MTNPRMLETNIICDSSTLLNFIRIGRFELLFMLSKYIYFIPLQVYREIKPEKGRGELLQQIQRGKINVQSLTEAELKLSAGFQQIRRSGPVIAEAEAAVVALAISRKWTALIDDKAGQKVITSHTGAYKTTADVIIELIKEGIITVDEADKIKGELEKAKFKIKGLDSFLELI